MRLNPLSKSKPKAVAPVFAVADLGGGEAEVVMYGDVMEESPKDWWTGEPAEGVYVSAESFNKELERIKDASHVTVRLNSGGGDLYTGIAIHNALKSLPARKTVRIEGLAASAASVIACAGDEVVAMPGSVFMVHAGYACLFGWYAPDELDAVKAQMDSSFRAMCNVYESKTGKPREEIETMVAEETWLVGREIADAGFADVYEDDGAQDEPSEPDDEGGLVVAGVRHDVSMYRRVPDLAARAMGKEPPAGHTAVAHTEEPPRAAEKKGETPMDVTELREQYPDLVAQVEAQSAKAERERIAAIDEIAAGIPADMVAKAKYEEPTTAQQLAFEAIRESKRLAAAYMADAASDAEESGADGVDAEPAEDGQTDEEREQAEAKQAVEEAAAVLRCMKGGVR